MKYHLWESLLVVPLLQWLLLWLIISICLEFLVLHYHWQDKRTAIYTSVIGNLVAFLVTIPLLIPGLGPINGFFTIIWLAPLDVGFTVGQSGVINRITVLNLSLSLLYYSFPLLLSILIEERISVIFKAHPEKRLVAVTGGKCATYAVVFLSLFIIGLWQGLTNPIDESRRLLSYFEGWFVFSEPLSPGIVAMFFFFYLFVILIVLPILLLVRFRPWRFIIRTIRENTSKEQVMFKNYDVFEAEDSNLNDGVS